MSWTRMHTLVAGIVLIALTNAVALFGAAWNRSGEEARLALTQRELLKPYPYSWYGNRENSGLSLTLLWRSPAEGSDRTPSYGRMGRASRWLDRAKMQELGFDVSHDLSTDRGRKLYEKQLPREALFVLELAGPAWERAVRLARDELATAEQKLSSSAGDKRLELDVKNAREELERETQSESRLFVVDAGLNADALRAKYPDRARYALVRGEVRPVSWLKPERPTGYLTNLSVPSINVPFELRRVLAEMEPGDEYDARKRTPFEAIVAFGKRLEPWMIEAKR